MVLAEWSAAIDARTPSDYRMRMPKIDIANVRIRPGCGYPKPFDEPCATRTRRRLGDAGGLRDFGVNLMTLPAGGWSSQRHWHSHEDEFVFVIDGELTLVEDQGESVLRAGDCATFPKNTGNGHHLINRSSTTAVYLEVGFAQSGRPYDLLGYRHEKCEQRRSIRAHGRRTILAN